jgi:hypothetical protein
MPWRILSEIHWEYSDSGNVLRMEARQLTRSDGSKEAPEQCRRAVPERTNILVQ